MNTFHYLSSENIPEDLSCSICHHPFVDPVTLKARSKGATCNHTFCNHCITHWLSDKVDSEEDHTCPFCQAQVSRRFATADRPIQNMVNSLKVKCLYHTDGCDWVGTRSNLQDHLTSSCLFKILDCPHKQYGCKWSQSKSLLGKHLTECPYESVSGLITKVNSVEVFQRSLQRKLESG